MKQMKTQHSGLSYYLSDNSQTKCEKCKADISINKLAENNFICPVCGKYNRVPARARIEMIADKNSFYEMLEEVTSDNPINFPGYEEKYISACKLSGENEAVLCGTAEFEGQKACIFVMEPKFMMGSMGSVVGEKITAIFEYATEKKLPVIGYTVSGGARMQEGIISLMQMEKVSAAVKRHSDKGLFYLAILTDPTTGGVTASFAMLGDVIISEPEALIGFAGKRVIEQVTGEKLPENFQSAEFQLENGFLDAIVKRENHHDFISKMLEYHKGGS